MLLYSPHGRSSNSPVIGRAYSQGIYRTIDPGSVLYFPYQIPYKQKGHPLRDGLLLKNPFESEAYLVGGAGFEPATLAV